MFEIFCLDKYGNVVTELTQWDINVKLYIENWEYDEAPTFHFCNTNSTSSLPVTGDLNNGVVTVKVPNTLLMEAYPIIAYVYVYDEDSGRTMYTVHIPVRQKPHQESYEYEDNIPDITLERLDARIATLIETARKNDSDGETLEITDARYGFDGVEYLTLGDAIRGQVKILYDELSDIHYGYDGTVYDTAGEAVREQSKNAIRYTMQTLDKEQKTQARNNIGASNEDTDSPIIISVDGNDIFVNDSAAKPLQGLKLFGKTTQEKTTGVQLVDISKVTGVNINNGSVISSVSDNEFRIVYDGVYSNTLAVFKFNHSLILDPGTYVLSVDKPLPFSFRFNYAFEPKLVAGQTSISFVVSEMVDIDHIAAEIKPSIGAFDVSFKFMVQKGTTVSPWESYTGGIPAPSLHYPMELKGVCDNGSITVTVNDQNFVVNTPDGLQGLPLASTGGKIDLNGQVGYANEIDIVRGAYIQRVKKIIFDGTENWVKSAATGCDQYTCKVADTPKDKTSLMCDRFSVGIDHVVGHCYFYDNIFGCNPYAAGTSTVDDWKANLEANPMTVIYVLATPIETELTAEQPCSGYLSTKVTNDADARMVVEYVADTETFVKEQIAIDGKTEIVYDNAICTTTEKGTSYACFFEDSLWLKSYKPYFTDNIGTFICRICKTEDDLPMRDHAHLVVLEEIIANCGDTVNINRLITTDMCIWIIPDSNNTLMEANTEPPFMSLIAGVEHSTLSVKNIENMRGNWWFAGEFVVFGDSAIADINNKLEDINNKLEDINNELEDINNELDKITSDRYTEVYHNNSNTSNTYNGANYACFFEESHYLKTFKPYFGTNTGTFICRICETVDGLPMRDGATLVVLKEITANCGELINIDMLISPDRCIWVDPGAENMILETKVEPAFRALIAGVDSGLVKNIENMRGNWWFAGEFVELVDSVVEDINNKLEDINNELEDINNELDKITSDRYTEVYHNNTNAKTTIKGASYACFFEESHYIKTYKPYFQTNSGTFICSIYETTDGLPMYDGAKLTVLKEITANCGDAVSIDMLISPDRCIWVDPGAENMLLETRTKPTFKALIAGVDTTLTVMNIEAMRETWWIAGEFVELVEPVVSEVISRIDKVADNAETTVITKDSKSEIFVSKAGSGEYETINDALSGYDKNSTRNILVDKGTYEEVVNVGIVDGLTIRGVSREHCIILNKTAQYKNAPITISGNFLIENLTLKMTTENEVLPTYVFPDGYPGYAIHMDSGSKNSNKENFGVVRNCILYSEAFPAVGLGTSKNQTIILDNCILIRNTTKDIYKKLDNTHRGGLIAHATGDNVEGSRRSNQRLIMRNCVIKTTHGMTGNIRTDTGGTKDLTVTFINNVFYSEELGFDCFDFSPTEGYECPTLDPISYGNSSSNLNSSAIGI